jgi:hypothetical protein
MDMDHRSFGIPFWKANRLESRFITLTNFEGTVNALDASSLPLVDSLNSSSWKFLKRIRLTASSRLPATKHTLLYATIIHFGERHIS